MRSEAVILALGRALAMVSLLTPVSGAGATDNAPPYAAPLFFVENHGQAPQEVQFSVGAPDIRAQFSADGVSFEWQSAALRLKFAGSSPAPAIEGLERLPGKANFLLGSDPSNWRTDVPVFAGIVYRELYPGVDMVYAGAPQRLKSEFLVAPGADPRAIQMVFEGARRVWTDEDGALMIETSSGVLREAPPVVYQEIDGEVRSVASSYFLHPDGSVGFELAAYDESRLLVIDPELAYSSYVGGSYTDAAASVAVDSQGAAYVAGWTDSNNLPTQNPLRTRSGGVEAFVIKWNPSGNSLVYATYLGGSGDDRALSVAVDSSGSVLLAGSTTSTNFPAFMAVRSASGGGRDAFAVKLDPTGAAFVYSTYLGGAAQDSANAIAVDTAGNAYIAGETASDNFPLANPYQNTRRGRLEAFVTKLSPQGSLMYSTLLGGSGDDRASAIAVDSSGQAYVSGSTDSTNFPVLSAAQTTNRGGQEAFVAKLAASGSSLVYSTYLGGSGGTVSLPESANGIAVDSSGAAYVTGVTSSSNFPTASAIRSTHAGGGLDAFAAKLHPSGASLVYSTYLGGSSADYGTSIKVDASGNAFITGYTASPNFPTAQSLQSSTAGNYDAFVTRLNSSGASLDFSTYLGGGGADGGTGIALDSSGRVYVAGQTHSHNFPTRNGFQSTNAGGVDVFLARIEGTAPPPPAPPPSTPPPAEVSPSSGSGSSQTFSFTYQVSGGFQNLTWAQVLINATLSGGQACYVYFERASAQVWLHTDAGNSVVGPVRLGSSGILENSQCVVQAAGSSTSGSGSTLTLNLALSFKPAFSGNRTLYTITRENSGTVSPWRQVGTWTVPGQGNQAPTGASVNPSQGNILAQVFAVSVSDSGGFDDVDWVDFLVSSGGSTSQACLVRLDRRANSIALYSDAGSSPLGQITPGSSATLENSQCTVRGSGSSVSGTGNTVTVRFDLIFKTAFAGTRQTYAQAQDRAGARLAWTQVGSWTVPEPAPPSSPAAVTPSSGSGTYQLFSFAYQVTGGFQNLTWAQVLINATVNGAQACYVYFDRASSQVWLHTDAGNAVVGPVRLGSSGVLENSQCVLYGATSSVSGSGSTLTLNLGLGFKPAFKGSWRVYTITRENSGTVSPWREVGSWIVP